VIHPIVDAAPNPKLLVEGLIRHTSPHPHAHSPRQRSLIALFDHLGRRFSVVLGGLKLQCPRNFWSCSMGMPHSRNDASSARGPAVGEWAHTGSCRPWPSRSRSSAHQRTPRWFWCSPTPRPARRSGTARRRATSRVRDLHRSIAKARPTAFATWWVWS
jgi:hypothetical protein